MDHSCTETSLRISEHPPRGTSVWVGCSGLSMFKKLKWCSLMLFRHSKSPLRVYFKSGVLRKSLFHQGVQEIISSTMRLISSLSLSLNIILLVVFMYTVMSAPVAVWSVSDSLTWHTWIFSNPVRGPKLNFSFSPLLYLPIINFPLWDTCIWPWVPLGFF
jgi:hypothetical protein